MKKIEKKVTNVKTLLSLNTLRMAIKQYQRQLKHLRENFNDKSQNRNVVYYNNKVLQKLTLYINKVNEVNMK